MKVYHSITDYNHEQIYLCDYQEAFFTCNKVNLVII